MPLPAAEVIAEARARCEAWFADVTIFAELVAIFPEFRVVIENSITNAVFDYSVRRSMSNHFPRRICPPDSSEHSNLTHLHQTDPCNPMCSARVPGALQCCLTAFYRVATRIAKTKQSTSLSDFHLPPQPAGSISTGFVSSHQLFNNVHRF